MVHPFVVEYLKKEGGNLNEKTSDNDDEKDDDDANSKMGKLLKSLQVKH